MTNSEWQYGPTGEHDHVWGELECSRMARTVHRKCQVDGCRFVNAYDDEREENDE